MVDDLEHVLVIADLRMTLALWIVIIGLFLGDLPEHGFEKQVDTGVVFDEVLELDEDRV